MEIVAPISSYKKNGLKIYMVGCFIAAAVLAYDGYLSKYEWSQRYDFYKKHVVDNDNQPDGTMLFNRYVSVLALVGGIYFAARFFQKKDDKIIADDNAVTFCGGEKINYDSIEKIDKSAYNSKGYFVFTYKDSSGGEKDKKLSNKDWDNLDAVMNLMVEKIS